MNYAPHKTRKVTSAAPSPKSLFWCGAQHIEITNAAGRNLEIPGDQVSLPDFLPQKAYVDHARNSCLIKVDEVNSGTSAVFAVFRNGRLYNDNPAQMEIISREKFDTMNDTKYGLFYQAVPGFVNMPVACATHNTSYQVTLYEVLRMKNCAKNCTGLRREAYDFGRKGQNSTFPYHAECKSCRLQKYNRRGTGPNPSLAWDYTIRSWAWDSRS